MRRVPRDHQPLDQVDGDEQEHADQRQHDERGEHERQVEVAVGDLQQVADAGVRADELADDRADDGQRHRDLEPGEDATAAPAAG